MALRSLAPNGVSFPLLAKGAACLREGSSPDGGDYAQAHPS